MRSPVNNRSREVAPFGIVHFPVARISCGRALLDHSRITGCTAGANIERIYIAGFSGSGRMRLIVPIIEVGVIGK
jgi:hypothetical protein